MVNMAKSAFDGVLTSNILSITIFSGSVFRRISYQAFFQKTLQVNFLYFLKCPLNLAKHLFFYLKSTS